MQQAGFDQFEPQLTTVLANYFRSGGTDERLQELIAIAKKMSGKGLAGFVATSDPCEACSPTKSDRPPNDEQTQGLRIRAAIQSAGARIRKMTQGGLIAMRRRWTEYLIVGLCWLIGGLMP